MRIGIYGGSFDPVHLGHLLLAETMREKLGLDQVRFIPAAVSPLKQDSKPTSDKQRVEMLELALGGNPALVLDDRELRRGGVSYTVETLRELVVEFPGDELFLLMGADSLADLPKWREPTEICSLALPAIVARGGDPEPDWQILLQFMSEDRAQQARLASITSPLIEISSSDLRNRVAAHKSIRYRVPRGVEMLIVAQGLYR